MNCEQRYGGRCRGEAEARGQQQRPGHSRDGPTPTATGRSSGRTMEIAVKRFILAVVRSHGESHAQDLERPHSGIAGCYEQERARHHQCRRHRILRQRRRRHGAPLPAATGEDCPELTSVMIIGKTTATANRTTCATTAAPRPWAIITARETTVETGPTPATAPCPPPLQTVPVAVWTTTRPWRQPEARHHRHRAQRRRRRRLLRCDGRAGRLPQAAGGHLR